MTDRVQASSAEFHSALAALARQDVLLGTLLFFALAFVAAVALIVHQNLASRTSRQREWLAIGGINVGAALVLWRSTPLSWQALVPPALCLLALAAASRLLRSLTPAGRFLMVTNACFALFALLGFGWFIATIPVSPLTRGLFWAAYALGILAAPTSLIQAFERWEVLCRTSWSRPHRPLPPMPRTHYPKVSIHVACYAEPPELVIATLDALARLRYPNFEVLVIDNNTPDPSLWQPLEAHCKVLGRRFRFFHLHRWAGAKSGALNFALRQTAPDAEMIALVDADYQADPNFLEAVIGYFDDPRLGFVQAPHHHREWEHSRYLRMCYWEYEFRQLVFASFNERTAAVLMGTMCVIRRQALESVGGWAEWCVTEDSELAIRIHAAGYSSIFLTAPLGHGLMPETFAGYKKQRFRWCYGPTQELKRHFRLYLPWPFGYASALSTRQILHHANHGLGVLNSGEGYLLTLLNLAIIASMLIHGEAVQVSLAVMIALLALVIAQFVLRWLTHHVVLRCSLQDMLRSTLASLALKHTKNVAGLWALGTRSIPWRRTSKFKALPMGFGAVASARSELLLGLLLLLLGAGSAAAAGFGGLLLLLSAGIVLQGFRCLAAPVLALIAERDLRQAAIVTASPPVATTSSMDEAATRHQSTHKA